MPANKSQHYVPKVYLRAFAQNEGKTINIYNVRSSRLIPNASLADQCAGDYFYGRDGALEQTLGILESTYGVLLKAIDKEINNKEYDLLNEFAYLQYSRTASALSRGMEMLQGMHETAHAGITKIPDLDTSHMSSVLKGINLYVTTREMIRDLKTCILRNNTHLDFITSDDPVILTSKFYVQKLQDRFFGIGSAGVTFFMPITPRLMMMSYDADIYYPGTESRVINLSKRADVLALNELQFVKDQKNIYFYNFEQGQQISEHFAAVTGKWRGYEPRFLVHIRDGFKYGYEYFRLATGEERAKPGNKLIGQSLGHPIPSTWPSILSYRLKPKTFYNGSSVGHLRLEAARLMIKKAPSERQSKTIIEPPKSRL